MLINLIQQKVRFLDERHNEIATLPPSEHKVEVLRDPNVWKHTITLGDGTKIPCMCHSAAAAVQGLPVDPDPTANDDDVDILVPLVVAEAMRVLGIYRSGRVYSPMPLVFDADRNPLGTPGLLLHRDLTYGGIPDEELDQGV